MQYTGRFSEEEPTDRELSESERHGTRTEGSMTRQQLIDLAASCEPRDFFGFAELVIRRDPVLGATVRLHAEAADGNSPDLLSWVEGTMHDYDGLVAQEIDTPTAARAWWMREYAGDAMTMLDPHPLLGAMDEEGPALAEYLAGIPGETYREVVSYHDSYRGAEAALCALCALSSVKARPSQGDLSVRWRFGQHAVCQPQGWAGTDLDLRRKGRPVACLHCNKHAAAAPAEKCAWCGQQWSRRDA